MGPGIPTVTGNAPRPSSRPSGNPSRRAAFRAAAVALSRHHGRRLPHRSPYVRMSVITEIVPVARPAGRFAVLVDGREAAVLSLEAIERLGLTVGRPVAGLEEHIALEAARLRTYDRALNVLAFRGRSSSELARSLLRKGEEKPHVDWAIARLTEQGLLDDAAFARAFTRAKVVGGKQSRRRVQQDLARKGVARSVTDDAIDKVFEEEAVDQRGIVEEAARKKLAGLEPSIQRRRLYAYLARRGYEVDDIREVLATLGPTIAGLDAVDDGEDGVASS